MNRQNYRSASLRPGPFSPSMLWGLFFLFWIGLVSGIGGGFDSAPGVLQAWQLYQLGNQKSDRLATLTMEHLRLSVQARALTSDSKIIRDEIRNSLGYIGEDELIFVFDSPESTL